MSKKTIINEIIDIYDENERLKHNIKKLTEKYDAPSHNLVDSEQPKENPRENMLDELGKELLFKAIFRIWSVPSVAVRDNGQFNFLTFDQWLKAIARDDFGYVDSKESRIIDELPLTEIKQYFNKQLNNYYTKAVNDKKMELVREAKEKKKSE